MTGSTVDAAATPKVAEIREALTRVKEEYRRLVDESGAVGSREPSGNAEWTRGELLYHIAYSAGLLAGVARNMLRGRGAGPVFLLPQRLRDRLSVLAVRRGARKATRDALIAKHDAGIDALLALLDGVQEADWARSAVLAQRRTLEEVVRLPVGHLDEHAGEMRGALAS